jgi:coenzyme F420-reducing hydrogenase beta subunit
VNKLDFICSKNRCTGCFACANICPKDAIKMVDDEYGFIRPFIDEKKCADCGLCKLKCPANSNENYNEIKEVYACWTKNSKERKKSTSGGMFSELSRYVLQQNGCVVGVQWSKNFTPEHIIVHGLEDLDKLKGSKYAQSNVGNIYIKVKDVLIDGKTVLFSGTPCQVAALRSFLGKEYDNLFCVDLVCHGVPSSKMLSNYYREVHSGILNNVSLRYKDPYWDYSYVKIDFDDGYHYQELTLNDSYFNLFNIGYSLRNSCHSCKYTSTNRVGDITLADFWGYLPNSMEAVSYNRGTSCVLLNTEKGKMLFSAMKNKVYSEKSTIEKAVQGNKCLKEPFTLDNNLLRSFWRDYEDGFSLKDLNEKYCADTFKLPSLMPIRRLYNKFRWVIKR